MAARTASASAPALASRVAVEIVVQAVPELAVPLEEVPVIVCVLEEPVPCVIVRNGRASVYGNGMR